MAITNKNDFRKNPLSLEPGGDVVKVTKKNGKSYTTDDVVKNDYLYLQGVLKRDFINTLKVENLTKGTLLFEAK